MPTAQKTDKRQTTRPCIAKANHRQWLPPSCLTLLTLNKSNINNYSFVFQFQILSRFSFDAPHFAMFCVALFLMLHCCCWMLLPVDKRGATDTYKVEYNCRRSIESLALQNEKPVVHFRICGAIITSFFLRVDVETGGSRCRRVVLHILISSAVHYTIEWEWHRVYSKFSSSSLFINIHGDWRRLCLMRTNSLIKYIFSLSLFLCRCVLKVVDLLWFTISSQLPGRLLSFLSCSANPVFKTYVSCVCVCGLDCSSSNRRSCSRSSASACLSISRQPKVEFLPTQARNGERPSWHFSFHKCNIDRKKKEDLLLFRFIFISLFFKGGLLLLYKRWGDVAAGGSPIHRCRD